MAYTNTRPISNLNSDSSINNGSTAFQAANTSTSSKFDYEIAEVLDIIIDDTHEYYEDPGSIGKIKYRLLQSERGKSKDAKSFAYPISTRFITYPILHETVVIINFLNRVFYSDVLNFLNAMNNDALPNLSTAPSSETTKSVKDYKKVSTSGIPNNSNEKTIKFGKYFKDLNNSIPIRSINEGDVALNGRFGNYIVLGGSKTGKPYIKMSVIDKSEYKLVSESTSNDRGIWITNDEIKFSSKCPKITENNNPPNEYTGNQIYIGSDRIILNSLKGDIVGFSPKSIMFSCEKNFVISSNSDINIKSKSISIDTNSISLGKNADEPLVLGNKLIQVLQDLITQISSITVVTSTGPSSPPVNAGQISSISAKLSSVLSKKNKSI